MGSSTEEIILRMKLDAASAEASTQTMLSQQRAAAREYEGFWNTTLARKEAAEIATAESIAAKTAAIEKEAQRASLARLEANEAEKAAARAAWMEEQAAQAAIARGSIPVSMGGKEVQIAENSTLKKAEHLGEDALGGAAFGGGAAAAGKASHSAINEFMVLIREGLRRNWSRMLGSFTRFLGFIGAYALPVIDVAVGTALVVGPRWWQEHKANKAAELSQKDLGSLTGQTAEGLRSTIEALRRHGMIDGETAEGYLGQLKNPTYSGVSGILGAVAKLMPSGGRAALTSEGFKSTEDKIKDADRLATEEQKQLDELTAKKRTEADVEADIAQKNEYIKFLKGSINVLDTNSLEYHEAKVRLLNYELDVQKDLTEQASQQKDVSEATKDWQKWSDAAARDYMRQRIGDSMEGAQYLTMSDLAGRRRTARLEKAYGKGGAYDLGAQGGAFSDIAYDAELAQKQQLWDRKYGNIDQANNDRMRYNADVNQLVSAGAASPQMLMEKILDSNEKLRGLFNSLVTSGALKVNVEGTD